MFRTGQMVELAVSFRGTKARNGKRVFAHHLHSIVLYSRKGSYVSNDVSPKTTEDTDTII